MNFTVWKLTAWSNILLFKFPSTNCFPFSMHNWIVGSSRCIVYLFHLEHSHAIMHCLNTRDEEDKWRAKQLNSLSELDSWDWRIHSLDQKFAPFFNYCQALSQDTVYWKIPLICKDLSVLIAALHYQAFNFRKNFGLFNEFEGLPAYLSTMMAAMLPMSPSDPTRGTPTFM